MTSKSGFLIRKRILRFFANCKIQKTDYWPKWSKTEVDSLDHIQNQILWIHDPKRFFTTDPKQNPVTRNNFNTHSSRLITLLTFSAIFEVEAWIKRSMVKSQCKQDVPCSSSQGQIETKLQHNFTGASCSILLFQQLSYFKTRLHSAHLKQYPWANQKNQQICSIISSRVILSSGYCRYCRSFLWKWMKNWSSFGHIVSFLNEKS